MRIAITDFLIVLIFSAIILFFITKMQNTETISKLHFDTNAIHKVSLSHNNLGLNFVSKKKSDATTELKDIMIVALTEAEEKIKEILT
ncbi:MAG: hypothetical protein HOB05_04825 [Bacteroidetes bacterium]|jgi:hypothetical protein|nr:hypothetical protein [Bacteroidota bacterium]MBT6685633.1 hypothetical protein [Bacteroidota bacterium]MBT7141852.1 hypothetical protein [Bacteroidota bacterium]